MWRPMPVLLAINIDFYHPISEHLNIVLFDLAKSYHAALKRVHINVGSETTSGRLLTEQHQVITVTVSIIN